MTTVAFVFARGGSRGLPGKNTRNFAGKPLIAWSIECALSVRGIERVIVSTDSFEISELAKTFGAEVPFIRPMHLASDQSPEIESWKHALTYLKESSSGLPDVMVSLPPTAPLRTAGDVDECLARYARGDCDVVVTTTEAHRNPYFNMVKDNPDGTVNLVMENYRTFRRQDAPIVRDMTTVCYVANPQFVLSCNSIFEGRVTAVDIPKERSVDIDSLLDFHLAEFLLDYGKES